MNEGRRETVAAIAVAAALLLVIVGVLGLAALLWGI